MTTIQKGKNGLFGEFRDNDRVIVGFEYGF